MWVGVCCALLWYLFGYYGFCLGLFDYCDLGLVACGLILLVLLIAFTFDDFVWVGFLAISLILVFVEFWFGFYVWFICCCCLI